MEDTIRTFMDFLKADKEKHLQIFTAFFKRRQRNSVDPTNLHLVKKANETVISLLSPLIQLIFTCLNFCLLVLTLYILFAEEDEV